MPFSGHEAIGGSLGTLGTPKETPKETMMGPVDASRCQMSAPFPSAWSSKMCVACHRNGKALSVQGSVDVDGVKMCQRLPQHVTLCGLSTDIHGSGRKVYGLSASGWSCLTAAKSALQHVGTSNSCRQTP